MPQNSSNRIEVILDVYPNIFNDDPNYRYQYSNIRVVNPDDRNKLDKVLTEMYELDLPFLFEQDLVNPLPFSSQQNVNAQFPEPIKKDTRAYLNLKNRQFEFK